MDLSTRADRLAELFQRQADRASQTLTAGFPNIGETRDPDADALAELAALVAELARR